MIKINDKFSDINYESRPVGISVETVKLCFSKGMFGDYAKAYYHELQRRNPRKLDSTSLTIDELTHYFESLFFIRIKSVNEGGFKQWRQAKLLYIPAWIQLIISQYGILYQPQFGLKIVPFVEQSDINFDTLLDISSRLSSFSDDGMFLTKDAFPREVEGDKDVMTMAVIENEVRGIIRSDTPSPIAQMVTAFTQAQIDKDITLRALYRISYDEVEFIKSMLLNDRRVLQ